MRWRRAPVVDVVDETFVRAGPLTVRWALEAPGVIDRLCPGLQREVVQDRGAKGVRWRVGGEVTGRMEVWLEEVHGGTIVHHFVHGEQRSGPRRWKRGMHDIKDRLEGGSR